MKILNYLLFSLALSQHLADGAANFGTNRMGIPVLQPTRKPGNTPPTSASPVTPPLSVVSGFTNAAGYALFVSTTNFGGGTLVVTWDNPNIFSALSTDKVELYRIEGTNAFIRDSKFITGNRFETFTLNEPGVYQVYYVEFPSKKVRAKSALITVGPPPLPPPVAAQVVAFGDSYALQIVPVLERRLGVPVGNYGVSGETTRQIRARLPAVLAAKPAIVIMSGGSRDIFDVFLPITNKVGHAETMANLDAMFGTLRARNIEVFYLGVFEGFLPFHADDYRTVAAKHGVRYIPDILSGVALHSSLMADEVHPNERGYEIIVGRFESKLRTFLGRTLLSMQDAGSAVVLSWFAQTNRTYDVQFTGAMGSLNWVNLGEFRGQGMRTNLVFQKSGLSGFYRLLVR